MKTIALYHCKLSANPLAIISIYEIMMVLCQKMLHKSWLRPIGNKTV